MLGVGMLQQMRPAIEAKMKDEMTKALIDGASSSSPKPNLKGMRREGDEVVVAFERDGKDFELVMEKMKGDWKFTKLSERSTKDFLNEMRKKGNGGLASASPDTTSAPVSSPASPVIPEPSPIPASTPVPRQQADSSGFNAEIVDPPSNCRTGPGSENSVKQVLARGDVLVDRENPMPDHKGEAWYRESYLGCWLHHSQIRLK
jgi:hypothetical protein